MVFYSDSAFTTGNLEAQNSQNHQNIVVIYRLQTLNNVLTMSICCNRCFTTKEICRFSCSENKQEHKVYYRCSSPSLSQNKICRPENEFYEILFGLFCFLTQNCSSQGASFTFLTIAHYVRLQMCPQSVCLRGCIITQVAFV